MQSEQRTKAHVDVSIHKLEASFKQSLSQVNRPLPPHQEAAVPSQPNREEPQRTYQPPRNNMDSGQPRECYYCYLTGHMVRDCPYKREDIDLGRILIENNRMKLGDGSPFPRYPDTKSQKQRVDDYYAGKAVPGAPQVFVQSYVHPRMEHPISQYQNSLIENLALLYDAKDDELRTMFAQRKIRDNTTQASAQHPVASFQASVYQPPQVYPNGGGAMPTYASVMPGNPMMQPPYQASMLQNYAPMAQPGYAPVPAPVPVVVPPAAPISQGIDLDNPVLPPGMNVRQFIHLVDLLRGDGRSLPVTQDQFAITRKGSTREAETGGQNF